MTFLTHKYKVIFFCCALIGVLGLGLAACGIKPGELTAPSGENARAFPAQYPK